MGHVRCDIAGAVLATRPTTSPITLLLTLSLLNYQDILAMSGYRSVVLGWDDGVLGLVPDTVGRYDISATWSARNCGTALTDNVLGAAPDDGSILGSLAQMGDGTQCASSTTISRR